MIRFARCNCVVERREKMMTERQQRQGSRRGPRPRERKGHGSSSVLTWYGNGDLQEKCGPKSERLGRQRSSTNDSLTTEMAAAAREKGQDQEGGMPGSTFMSWPAEATEVRHRISPEAPSDQGGWEARPGGESVHRPPQLKLCLSSQWTHKRAASVSG